jgi:Ca2+-binding EF-hand superfamily protein
MDTDHSGTLDLTEVGHLVRKIIPVTDRQLKHLLKAIDVDGSGYVDENELIAFVTDTQQPCDPVSTERAPRSSEKPKKSLKVSCGTVVESAVLPVDR